jgi:hypothetical protein
MKTRLLLIVMAALLLAASLPAQTRKEREAEKRAAWRKERAERRAEAIEQDSVAFIAAVQALQAGCFVLEADNVTLPNGVMRFVSSSTNFVSVCEGDGTVQTAFNGWAFNSPNGLGGVTVQGSVGGVQLRTDKDGNVFYSFGINGVAISATAYITLTQGTNQASITINPNFSGQNLTMNGYLVPYEESNVFEGSSI